MVALAGTLLLAVWLLLLWLLELDELDELELEPELPTYKPPEETLVSVVLVVFAAALVILVVLAALWLAMALLFPERLLTVGTFEALADMLVPFAAAIGCKTETLAVMFSCAVLFAPVPDSVM